MRFSPEMPTAFDKPFVQLELSQGLFALIDWEDYARLMEVNVKWFAHQSRKTFYAETKLPKRRGVIKMHRFLMDCPNGMEVDHINRNGLDNRKANLRIVTQAINKQNKGIYSNNTSGVPGVYYCVRGRGQRHWHAQITRDKVQRLLGDFLTKEEAIACRLETERAYADK